MLLREQKTVGDWARAGAAEAGVEGRSRAWGWVGLGWSEPTGGTGPRNAGGEVST